MGTKVVNIDYREILNDSDFLTKVHKEIDIAVDSLKENGQKTKINISNIVSHKFCDLFDIEAEEFNGWQCDWNSYMNYRNERINIFGEAWYGNVFLTIE